MLVPTGVALDAFDCAVDVEAAAADEYGTALGWTCALSSLMISAA